MKLKLLSLEEKGIAFDLLCWMCEFNGKLPKEDDTLKRLLGLDESQKPLLSSCLNKLDDIGFLDEIKFLINKQIGKSQLYSENGKKGGRKKKQSVSDSLPNGLGNNNHNHNQDSLFKDKEKGKKETKSKPPEIVLPDWLPEKDWLAFVEMRKKIKAPLTADAVSHTIRDLTKIRNAGLDPVAAIQKSTQNAWRGVFPPKEEIYAKRTNGSGNAGGNASNPRSTSQHGEFQSQDYAKTADKWGEVVGGGDA